MKLRSLFVCIKLLKILRENGVGKTKDKKKIKPFKNEYSFPR